MNRSSISKSLISHLVLPKLFNCSVKSLFLENLLINICRNDGDFNLQLQKVDLRVWETKITSSNYSKVECLNAWFLSSGLAKIRIGWMLFWTFLQFFSCWLTVVVYGIMKHEVRSITNKLDAIMWSIILLDFTFFSAFRRCLRGWLIAKLNPNGRAYFLQLSVFILIGFSKLQRAFLYSYISRAWYVRSLSSNVSNFVNLICVWCRVLK